MRCFYNYLKVQFPSCHPVPQRPLSHQPHEEASFFCPNGSPALSFRSTKAHHLTHVMFHLLCGTQDKKSSEGRTGVTLPAGGSTLQRARSLRSLGRLWSTCERVCFQFSREEKSALLGSACYGPAGSSPRALELMHVTATSVCVPVAPTPLQSLGG